MGVGDHIYQHWSPSSIALSYLISVTGSFCTIQLMEQWRQYDTQGIRFVLMALSAFTLGGCGIWCTHFTGMTALDLVLDDGTALDMHFDLGLTIVSFIFPVMGVFVGLKIASTDPFFLEIEANRRKNLLVKDLAKTKMKNIVRKSKVARQIQYTALFSRLWRILAGGFCAALGVVGMHYLGMSAQRTNARMEFDGRVVVVSCVVAFATANAAFWILFRAHTFWPNNDGLRVASALTMGVAVCGTHYSGMGSATYFHTDESFSSDQHPTISGQRTAVVASHGAILICYWLTSLAVTKSVKLVEARHRSRAETSHAAQVHTTTQRIDPSYKFTRGATASVVTARARVYAAPDDAEAPLELDLTP